MPIKKEKKIKGNTNQIDIEEEPLVTTARAIINIEEPSAFCDEFSKPYTIFQWNGYESNDSETANINFVIKVFGRPTIIPTDN